MKRFLIFFFFPTILLCFFIFGCKKKTPTTYYIPESLKQYSVFQLGSYWVYKNEQTGTSDSCFTKSPPIFNYIHWGGYDTDPIYETMDIYYGGNFIFGGHISPEYFYGLEFYNKLGSDCLVSESFQPGFIKVYDNGGIFKVIDTFDSFIVNNSTFYNVICTQYKVPEVHGFDTLKFTYYFGKSIGLIKYIQSVNNHDTIWSLIRYHVVL